MKERDYFFDNLKAVLIFLVVVGHFILPITNSHSIVGLKYLIYIFHMPVFIFVTGYFSKTIYKSGKYNYNKIFSVIILYIMFMIAINLLSFAFGKINHWYEIDYFNVKGAPWYLLAMILYYFIIPFIKDIKPGIVIFISCILSLLVGYQKSIDGILSLSRIIVFSPFFFAGYYITKKNIDIVLRNKFKYIIYILAIIFSVLIVRYYNIFSKYCYLVYADSSYYDLKGLYKNGIVARFIIEILAVLFMLFTIYITPKRKMVFTFIGERTLQIYIFHRLIRDAFNYLGGYKYFNFTGLKGMITILIICFLVTIILSIKPLKFAFDKLFDIKFDKLLCKEE